LRKPVSGAYWVRQTQDKYIQIAVRCRGKKLHERSLVYQAGFEWLYSKGDFDHGRIITLVIIEM
jgi:hypothetical protein